MFNQSGFYIETFAAVWTWLPCCVDPLVLYEVCVLTKTSYTLRKYRFLLLSEGSPLNNGMGGEVGEGIWNIEIAHHLMLLLIPACSSKLKIGFIYFLIIIFRQKNFSGFLYWVLLCSCWIYWLSFNPRLQKIIFWLIPNSCKCLLLQSFQPGRSSLSLCICHMSYSERKRKAFISLPLIINSISNNFCYEF